MMYREFVEATGCKMTDKNYQIFKGLEILYMNSDMSKDEVYKMGMKLVDNSKTERELEIERELNKKLADMEEKIEDEQAEIERYKIFILVDNDPMWKKSIKVCEKRIREYEVKVKSYKALLKELAA